MSYACFITSVVNNRIPIFTRSQYCDILIEDLQFYRTAKQFLLLGYLIMPDHVHMIFHPEGNYSIGEILRDYNKHTAHAILHRMKVCDARGVKGLSSITVHRNTRKHQVWQEEPWKEEIFSEHFFMQKLDYIHRNPIRKGLAVNPKDRYYSSFRSLYLEDHRPNKVDRMWFSRPNCP